jgi:uncharacterized protein
VIVYLDTSAVVKTIVDEEGSDDAEELWTDATIRLTSVLSYAECRAALAAARRGGRLSTAQARAARRNLDHRWAELAAVSVEDAIVRDAGDLADRLALRGCDAVHLACALAAAEGGTLVFATWDRDLAAAALSAGLPVAPAV